jgi:hypothetical protein
MDFIVRDAKYVQRQPLGNDHCEFYVMHFMHVHSGDDMTVANRKVSKNLSIYNVKICLVF